MNFRLSGIKVILSIVVGLIFGNLFGWQQIILPNGLGWIFAWGPFFLFGIVVTLLVYLIWSLMDKK